jgi:hypothetical protein
LFVALDAEESASKTKDAGLCTDTAALLERMGSGFTHDPPVRRILRSLRRSTPLLEPTVARLARLRHQWPGGPPLSRHLPAGGRHLLVVSPFLRDRILQTLLERFERITLISTGTALDGLGTALAQALVRPPHRVWAMQAGLAAGAEAGDADGRDEDEAQEVVELDLHAKLLVAEGGQGNVTLLGSANATNAAWFGVNAEAMVELRPGLSRQDFLRGFAVKEGDVDAPTDQLALRPWLRPWRPRTVEPDPAAAAEQHVRDLLDRAVAWLAGLDLQGTRSPDRLRLCIRAADREPLDEALAALEEELELSFWLASRPGTPRPIRELLDGSQFEDLALVELTELVGVRVQARQALEDGRELSLVRLLRFDLALGAERGERNKAIFRELLSSADFDRLLRAMLSGLPAESSGDDDEPPRHRGRKSGGGGLGRGQQAFAGVTLEQLLRACSEQPSLVDDIDELVQVFAADPERLSEDFRRIWPPLRKALRSRSLR